MPRTLSKTEVSAFQSKLCQTAEELFITYGVNGFTMRRLAAAVGVSAMTPYRYYHNKAALLAAVRANAFNVLADILKNAYLGGGEPEDILSRQCRSYIDFASAHRDQYQLMFGGAFSTSVPSPELEEAYQACQHWLLASLQDIFSDEKTVMPLEKTALILWSTLHGVIATCHIRHITDSEKISAIVLQAIGYLVTGSRLTDWERDTPHPSMTKVSCNI